MYWFDLEQGQDELPTKQSAKFHVSTTYKGVIFCINFLLHSTQIAIV